ncbi:hypothetical protein F5Y17DRAFT_168418 [Xylariaceae sp. FL0594]|nr:hypothetical protein F5Y17DRAFT_168418 [Xylariaceae sp. FL0594]
MAVSPLGTFFIIFFIFAFIAVAGWVVFTQLRARRLGLPSPPLSSYIPFVRSSSSYQSQYGGPQPRPGGIRGWINDRFRTNKNTRSATGAYEQPSAAASRQHGFGPLDPDEAWDARVGHEAYGIGPYYHPDEQELEDRPHTKYAGAGASLGAPAPYTGAEYHMNLAGAGDGAASSSSRGRSPNPRPMGSGSSSLSTPHNPFDDENAEPSNIDLRRVSPRPIDTGKARAAGSTGAGAGAGAGTTQESPTSVAERRSVFREDV